MNRSAVVPAACAIALAGLLVSVRPCHASTAATVTTAKAASANAAAAAPPAGWLGVTLGTTDLLEPDRVEGDDRDAAPGLAAGASSGAVITGVVKDGPADRAGVRAGDLVVRLGSTTVSGPSDVQRAVAAAPPGEWSELEILRGAQRRTLSVRIGQRSDATQPELRRAFIGVTPVDVPLQLRQLWGGDEDRGVLLGEVVPSGPAARGGLRAGDLVLRINGHSVGNPIELTQRLQLGGVGNSAEIEISRQGTLLTLEVELEDAPPPVASGPGAVPARPGGGGRGAGDGERGRGRRWSRD